MKLLRVLFILTFVVSSILFARTDRSENKIDINEFNIKGKHYWVKDVGYDNESQLDRKRTHKRRRKIKKPVKGLR